MAAWLGIVLGIELAVNLPAWYSFYKVRRNLLELEYQRMPNDNDGRIADL